MWSYTGPIFIEIGFNDRESCKDVHKILRVLLWWTKAYWASKSPPQEKVLFILSNLVWFTNLLTMVVKSSIDEGMGWGCSSIQYWHAIFYNLVQGFYNKLSL